MRLAETYATRYAEGDKSWDSLVKLFESAMSEGANRERGRCVKVMRAYQHKHAEQLDDLATWEVVNSYIEAIQPSEAGITRGPRCSSAGLAPAPSVAAPEREFVEVGLKMVQSPLLPVQCLPVAARDWRGNEAPDL